MTFFAHSENDNGCGIPETLSEHLQRVADQAAKYAEPFDASEQARAAGLLHDLGKYTNQFRKRLKNPKEPARDHSSAGALLVAKCYKHWGTVPALAIQGHHCGLQKLCGSNELAEVIARAMLEDADGKCFTDTDVTSMTQHFKADGLANPKVANGLVPSNEFSAADMLDVRMLFSALVDADFVETEAHFSGDAAEPRRYRVEGPSFDAAKAIAAAQKYLEEVKHKANVNSGIRNIRDTLLTACIKAATRPVGLFSLSAPTGSGKTLAMLAFALHHAQQHGLRRIVLVMPFLNIIDQTAQEYRKIFIRENGFPKHYVIEDHSNVQPPPGLKEGPAGDAAEEHSRIDRLLAENWDAPIVLTTSVQCLESLLSNRPSGCRKLHRLANSVILFDEVQTLPPHLAVVTLATLSRLSERFGSTVVFATATQPAFDHLHEQVKTLCRPGWQVTEIVPDPQSLYVPSSKRVNVHWRHRNETSWEDVADELARCKQVLCIVNLKRHAVRLVQLLKEREVDGLFHLSTNMCAAHRLNTLAKVNEALKPEKDRPVRLISTQCVEAGVDIDFPVVYRALAPLEAIAQAAGRCNRHGLKQAGGEVYVFRPESDGSVIYPPGAYKQAADVTKTYLNALADSDCIDLDQLEILNDPDRLVSYYRLFYELTGITEGSSDLNDALTACNFEKVARLYRLIDRDAINVLVRYNDQEFERLKREIEETDSLKPDFIRQWIRAARPHAVSIYRPKRDDPLWANVEPIQFSRRHPCDNDEAHWFVALPGARYDKDLLGWLPSDDTFVI